MVQKLVLVVDDTEDNRLILRLILEHAGFGVVEATDGREAVVLAWTRRPVLVLMDLQLPVMDGWMALRALRDHPTTTEIPVIAFSSEDHRSSLKRLQQAGFCGYLKKPYPPSQVLDAVRRCLTEISVEQRWVDLPPAEFGPLA